MDVLLHRISFEHYHEDDGTMTPQVIAVDTIQALVLRTDPRATIANSSVFVLV